MHTAHYLTGYLRACKHAQAKQPAGNSGNAAAWARKIVARRAAQPRKPIRWAAAANAPDAQVRASPGTLVFGGKG